MRRVAVVAVALLVGSVCCDTWIWSEPTGSSPQPRFEHTAERIGNQLFVFGGTLTNDMREADVHALDLDTDRWEELATTGNKPGATKGHASVTDGATAYLLFGSNGRSMTNKVYRLDTATKEWSRIVPQGRVPSARSYHSAVKVDDEVFVFGGYDGRFYLNDLHKWSLPVNSSDAGVWTKLSPTGDVPDVRASASMEVYGRKLYLFGGFEVAVYKNDFFELDLDTLVWSRVRLSATESCVNPPARAMASLTLVGTRLVLFGGIYCASSGECTELADVHQFDIFRQVWTSDQPEGLTPPARYGHSANLFGSKVLIFGGSAWPNLYNDIFWYDVYDNTFTEKEGLPPYARKQHSLHVTKDEHGRDQLVMFGGKHGSSGYSHHLHFFDIESATWSHPTNQGQPPAPVGHFGSALIDSDLYVIGGFNGTHSANAVHLCDIYTQTWSLLDVDGVLPPPAHGHAVVAGQGRLLQFGGVDCQGENCVFFNDMHSLARESLIWSVVDVKGALPRPRASHTFTTISATSHLLFGGIGPYFSNYNDLYAFDEPTESWHFVDAKGTKPAPRYGHAAVNWAGKLLVFGGGSCRSLGDCQYFNDVHVFVPATSAWSRMDVQGSYPASRLGSAAAALGNIVYMHGGATGDRIFGELFTVQPDHSVPAATLTYGFGKSEGTAGKNVKFFVQAQDSYGRNRTTGGDEIKISMTPTSRTSLARLTKPVDVSVLDNANGIYTVEYSTPVADRYNVTLTMNGEDTTPFTTRIFADVPDEAHTHSKGSGLSRCRAGEECAFSVELIDSLMNRVLRKSHLDIQFVGPRRVMKKQKDTGDGIVKVTYTPEKAGTYALHVRVRGKDTVGSPFKLTVVPTTASPLTSRADGPGLITAQAGSLGSISLQLLDRFGNAIAKGGDQVRGELTGPDELACAVVDHENGTYSLSYTAIRHGAYNLNLALNDEPLDSSPFPVLVTNAPISSAATFAHGSGLRYAIAGYRSYFTIQGADDFGNNMTVGGAKFNVLFAGPGEDKQECDVVDHGNGQYTVSYVTTVAGDFMISATLWNSALGYQSIHLSPYLGTTVAAGADPTKSYLYIDSPAKPMAAPTAAFEAVMGVHNYFHIQAVDRYGNKKMTGGDHFVAELEGPVAHDGFVSDNGDGTYTGAYVAPAAGKYWLKLYYGAVPLAGSPLQVQVRSNFDNCPNACSGHGSCVSNTCVCVAGFSGADCSVATGLCPANCMGNGACLNNTCYCFPGFAGTSCETATTLCPNHCSKHGECVDTMCVCDPGYEGADCSDNSLMCPDACSNNGECVDGKCLCYPGFSGESCATRTKFCPKGCSGRGQCMQSGMCSCYAGFTGLDCGDTLLPAASLTQVTKQVKGGSTGTSSLQPELPARLPRKPAATH